MKLLREPLFLLLLSGLMVGLVYQGLQAPAALPSIASTSQFSAERSFAGLKAIYQENLPHPAGSEHQALIRHRISEQFEQLGYEVSLQSLDHCNAGFGLCSPVVNIVARLQGKEGKAGLLLTAHYDSVEAGPGAGDDGSGVAALLEIAAMAARHDKFRHDLVFLVSDAEETGLVGADAFSAKHDWFKEVNLVINLEARGVSGASTMFETGDGNRSLIRILGKALDKPVANSLSREVYKRMPNDTDFSVYRDLGLNGFNFAFTGGAAVYHSAIDNIEHLDLASLQHHGQNAWQLMIELDQRDINRIASREDAVYVDLFGMKLLHYPASSATGLALVLTVLILMFVRMAFPRQLTLRQSAWAGLGIILFVPFLAGLGWLLAWPLGHWIDLNSMGHPYPWPGRIALLIAAVWVLHLTLHRLSENVTAGSATMMSWMFFALLGGLLSVHLPAASFVAIVPMVAFLLGSVIDGFLWKRHPQLIVARLLGFLAALYLGLYFFFALEVVLSFEHSMYRVLPLLLPLVAALPLLAGNPLNPRSRTWGTVLLLLPILACCIGQQFIPGHTVDRPRAMNLVYKVSAEEPGPAWILETRSSGPDLDYAARHGFEQRVWASPGQEKMEVLARPADRLEFAAVRLLDHGFEEQGERLKLRISLDIPAGVRQLAIFPPQELGLERAYLNSILAIDEGRGRDFVIINRPAPGPLLLDLSFAQGVQIATRRIDIPARLRYGLKEQDLQQLKQGWPLDAQANQHGHRAEIVFLISLDK